MGIIFAASKLTNKQTGRLLLRPELFLPSSSEAILAAVIIHKEISIEISANAKGYKQNYLFFRDDNGESICFHRYEELILIMAGDDE